MKVMNSKETKFYEALRKIAELANEALRNCSEVHDYEGVREAMFCKSKNLSKQLHTKAAGVDSKINLRSTEMLNLDNQPEIFQRQHDLQHEILNSLLYLDDDAITDMAVREQVKSLKRLNGEIQSAPEELLSLPSAAKATGDQEQSIWAKIANELLKQGIYYPTLPFPSKSVGLYNNTGSPIFVRTFDERDSLRWVAYGSYTINPNTISTVYARGDSNFQVDIRGQVFRVDMGTVYAYDGNGIIRRP
jgi:hypothetical protein